MRVDADLRELLRLTEVERPEGVIAFLLKERVPVAALNAAAALQRLENDNLVARIRGDWWVITDSGREVLRNEASWEVRVDEAFRLRGEKDMLASGPLLRGRVVVGDFVAVQADVLGSGVGRVVGVADVRDHHRRHLSLRISGLKVQAGDALVRREPLEVVLWKVLIGEQAPESLPTIAARSLADGLDSPNLRVLAGLPVTDSLELRKHFFEALGELGTAVPSEAEARWRLAHFWAGEIVAGRVTAERGATLIARECEEAFGENVVERGSFRGLLSQWEDWPEGRLDLQEQIVELARVIVDRGAACFPCPACGHLVFGEPPGSFDICPVCFWEDDVVQLLHPDMAGGANRPSLREAQENFAATGAIESRLLEYVRPANPSEPVEAGWRPLDLAEDDRPPRHRETVKDTPTDSYWWRTPGRSVAAAEEFRGPEGILAAGSAEMHRQVRELLDHAGEILAIRLIAFGGGSRRLYRITVADQAKDVVSGSPGDLFILVPGDRLAGRAEAGPVLADEIIRTCGTLDECLVLAEPDRGPNEVDWQSYVLSDPAEQAELRSWIDDHHGMVVRYGRDLLAEPTDAQLRVLVPDSDGALRFKPY